MKNSMVMFTLFVFGRYPFLWKFVSTNQNCFLTEAEIRNLDECEFAKFDGDVLFLCFCNYCPKNP